MPAAAPTWQASDPDAYLGSDAVIDLGHPCVRELFARIARVDEDEETFAHRAFEHVRDEVSHSFDVDDPRVTVSASDVAREGVGLCYAKSHLLVALMRLRGIPAGLCYQRLSDGAGDHVVHGLAAVWFRGSWHRLDPRGNKPGVDAQFVLGSEQLAFVIDPSAGEIDYPTVHQTPPVEVVAPLRAVADVRRAQLASEVAAQL